MRFLLGQKVKLKDEFYNIDGIVLEYKTNPVDLSMNKIENLLNPSRYLVEIAIDNKIVGKQTLHKVWINEDDLK